MPKFPRDGYGAIGAEVFLERDIAMIVFDIDDPESEKIRIHMRRLTFDDLAVRIAKALFGANSPAPGR